MTTSSEPGNCYADAARAAAYATLEFPGTYFLAFRDLPAIIRAHVTGTRALDFGCGAGRSTRFLRSLGFTAQGVDIAAEMIAKAREIDPDGAYLLVGDGDLTQLVKGSYDLVLCAFPFDNIATAERKVSLLRQLGELLRPDGRIINLVSRPVIYQHEWASFSTRAFPENRTAADGDRIRIVMKDVDDSRPVEDVLWSDESYRAVYRRAGLEVVLAHCPLGRAGEPVAWVNESRIAPWCVYLLLRNGAHVKPTGA